MNFRLYLLINYSYFERKLVDLGIFILVFFWMEKLILKINKKLIKNFNKLSYLERK